MMIKRLLESSLLAALAAMPVVALIIDEVQRKPDLFRLLRGLVDIRKRAGEKSGQFLLLGSASRDLIQQSSETLAGRIRFLELSPFSVLEIHQHRQRNAGLEKLWL